MYKLYIAIFFVLLYQKYIYTNVYLLKKYILILGNGMLMLPVIICIVVDLWLEPLLTHLAWFILREMMSQNPRLSKNLNPNPRSLNGDVQVMMWLSQSKIHPIINMDQIPIYLVCKIPISLLDFVNISVLPNNIQLISKMLRLVEKYLLFGLELRIII